MTDYILEITFPPELEDIIQGRLFLTRSTGSMSTHEGTLAAYFATDADRDSAAAALSDLDVDLRRLEGERTDWLQLYQQSLQPLFLGRSFVVAPEPGLIPEGSGRHALVVPQEQAFGTGAHESTALAIELLERMNPRGRLGLDIGAGSGILALAMLRLGARKVIACDIDLDAFRPMRENRARNRASAMPIFIGTIDALRGGRFDIITMNILPDVIVPLLPALKRPLAGELILSGILEVQREYVAEACERQGLRLSEQAVKGEWWAGSFRFLNSKSENPSLRV